MFRNVYGIEKENVSAAPGVAEFIEENDIVAIHEIVDTEHGADEAERKRREEIIAKFNHTHCPTLYFLLPDGTQTVEPAVDKVPPERILEKLEALMKKYDESRK